MKILDTIQSPSDIRKLPVESLQVLANEIREFLIDAVSKTGGHLASSLGTVELTLALHYSYNTPIDKLIWDVGHQAYTHKIITGRKDQFNSLRQYGGISGFPRISESEYDALSVGHASTSISAGLGMAIGRDLLKEKSAVIAVIGDGSLGGGLAFEGLNNLGSSATSMTVILNDNEMSISKNVGAMSRYLTRVITDERYNKLKSEIWQLLGNLSNVGRGIRSLVSSVDDSLKHFMIPGKLFQDMGLRYIGPVDGHNISEMLEIFKFIKRHNDPALVHIITKKGKGYSFAEIDATKYHGVGGFSKSTGTAIKIPGPTPTFSDVFGQTIIDIAKKDSKIVAITAAMTDGTRLTEFKKEFPNRFFDVGIAESHAVTFAAGLALKGLRPVVALYSTFLQRAYDQIMHDIALDKLPVIFCIDRAGLVGDDGPTHHGMFDLSFLRSVPNAVIMAPADVNELRAMLFTAAEYTAGPVFIRYPRGCGRPVEMTTEETLPVGIPEMRRNGNDCAIISIGDCAATASDACDLLEKHGIHASHINARFVKPLDRQWYRSVLSEFPLVVTVENNTRAGGFGSAILELASSLDLPHPPRISICGLPDDFVQHGEVPKLLSECGLDAEGIARQVMKSYAACEELLPHGS